MANCCISEIKIRDCENREDRVKKLAELLEQWTSEGEYCDASWLGNIVSKSGIGTVSTGLSTDLRCRGTLDDYDVSGNELTVWTDTAWTPMLKMWLLLAEKYIPGAEITYSASESGFGLFFTNDPDKLGCYYADVEDCEIDDYSEQAIIELLQRRTGSALTNIDKLVNLYLEKNPENVCIVHEWQYESIENWD